jgi:hypothetical protein
MLGVRAKDVKDAYRAREGCAIGAHDLDRFQQFPQLRSYLTI